MKVFDIKNLECRYPNTNHSVLSIDELNIEHSEVVFVIGASGVGKSTILETLGVMNNTVYSNHKTKFTFQNQDGEQFDFLSIWTNTERELARFRKKELSFIFQNTNLFNTISALDNVLMPLILDNKNKNYNLILSKVLPILNFIFDSTTVKEIIGQKKVFDDKGMPVKNKNGKFLYEPLKMINQLSGGQRQRLAFVRAIASEFTVLLADEPTGNLDPGTADSLMKLLVDAVKDTKSTAIIVTHDISLAVKHADKIVFIKKDSNPEADYLKIGKIKKEWTFSRDNKNWLNHSNSNKNSDTMLIKLFNQQLKEDSK